MSNPFGVCRCRGQEVKEAQGEEAQKQGLEGEGPQEGRGLCLPTPPEPCRGTAPQLFGVPACRSQLQLYSSSQDCVRSCGGHVSQLNVSRLHVQCRQLPVDTAMPTACGTCAVLARTVGLCRVASWTGYRSSPRKLHLQMMRVSNISVLRVHQGLKESAVPC